VSRYVIAAVMGAVVSLVTGTAGTANAQSAADVIVQSGLVGAWASDCSQPTSDSNYLTVYAIKGSDVAKTYYDRPDHIFTNYKIVNAVRQSLDTLSYTQVWDFDGKPGDVAGDRMNVVLDIHGEKFQTVSSQGSDGTYFVKDRKFTGSGGESPWQLKCR
jgi:hypothetical protein